MKRLPLAVALIAAVLSCGWFFRRVPAPSQDAIYSGGRGGSAISVRHDPAPASEAAERAAAELRADGWAETPVSTPSFHLLTRGNDVVALVAEDLPSGGSRVTSLHHRRALW